MNWKQFLKPDKMKIIIFVLVVILMFVSMTIYSLSRYVDSRPCEDEECRIRRQSMYDRQRINDSIFIFVASPFLAILFFLTDVLYTNAKLYEFLELILFILSFFYWYLLSCFIIWIYDKFRKGKKN